MSERKQPDEVIKELWAVKDSTAAQYSTVGEYLSHLRKSEALKKKMAVSATNSSRKARSLASRRKATA